MSNTIVYVKLDLDKYKQEVIEQLYRMGFITMEQATESKCIKSMNDAERLVWIRQMHQLRNNPIGKLGRTA